VSSSAFQRIAKRKFKPGVPDYSHCLAETQHSLRDEGAPKNGLVGGAKQQSKK
jgi:hypothetical protein